MSGPAIRGLTTRFTEEEWRSLGDLATRERRSKGWIVRDAVNAYLVAANRESSRRGLPPQRRVVATLRNQDTHMAEQAGVR